MNTLISLGSHALIINHKLEKPSKFIKNCCLFKHHKTKVDCDQNRSSPPFFYGIRPQ